MVLPVNEHINFPREEEIILEFWNKIKAFENTLKQSKGKPRYSFYDGPPFATGLPHYGHILAGTIKDIVTRYAHQSGFHVDRRFGWDCHGLPVEYEIDKKLGIKGPEDVAAMGIEQYNNECRSIVMRYSADWEMIVNRLGRWIDFKNDYKTMYPWFMETVWWIFQQLYDKGFVYSGYKVMPFSTACNTPLSNFEAGQNYKDVVDPAIIVSFPLDEDPNIKMVAWTTTPWTLPSNLALCVHPDMDYVKILDIKRNETFIFLEARICALYKTEEEYKVIEKFKGKTLENKSYKPLFPYFEKMKATGAFRVLCDGYVTDDSGTGVVHQSPYFGADDYRVCLSYGVITKDGKSVCPVDACGKFTEEVTDFAGQYVKDADKNICKMLKSMARLVHQSTTKHNYPFCWRSDTPLLYKAVPSWFIRVEQMTEQLLKNNSESYWVPSFVQEKRFANWLRDAHDWAVSRNRYWGTPIPLWVSDDMEEVVCVGSLDELEKLTGVRIKDLHRESVDKLTIPSRLGKGVLRRVPEVFDCWFESGSMPYAQMHYPFENKKEFEESFPADFIAEGIDQTRGWFYTLLVLSTAIFGKPPFKNLIVNGLVLASDGHKMSKRKKNFPDPLKVVHQYGADALRLYLINSPVVRAENLRFQEAGVKDVLKDVFLPWYNAYRFLVQNVLRMNKEENVSFKYNRSELGLSNNIMDKWILSATQSLILFFKKEMKAYHLYTVVPRLVKFVDLLTNWYVRSNRRRLKGEGGFDDCENALQTLFSVLYSMLRLMSPFTPFLTEHMYQNLRSLFSEDPVESIHYLMLPEPRENLIDIKIETAVSRMQTVIELARVIRDRNTLPIKYPLRELIVIHKDDSYLSDVKSLERYVIEELNVRNVTMSSNKDKYGVSLRAEPDHVVLGKRLKGAFKEVSAGIRQLTSSEVEEFQRSGMIQVKGHDLVHGDLRVIYQFTANDNGSGEGASKYSAHSDNDVLVLLDVSPDQDLLDEGVAREVVNRIQKLRKKAKLVPTDDVTAYLYAEGKDDYLRNVVEKHLQFISTSIKSPMRSYPVPITCDVIIEEETELKLNRLNIALVRGHITEDLPNEPICKYINVELQCFGNFSGTSTVLLENPRGTPVVSNVSDLMAVISRIIDPSQAIPAYATDNHNGPIELKSGSTIILQLSRVNSTLAGTHISDSTGIFNSHAGMLTKLHSILESDERPGSVCSFVNVKYLGTGANNGKVGTVLLESPFGENPLNLKLLKSECSKLFGKVGKEAQLFIDKDCKKELEDLEDIINSTLYVL